MAAGEGIAVHHDHARLAGACQPLQAQQIVPQRHLSVLHEDHAVGLGQGLEGQALENGFVAGFGEDFHRGVAPTLHDDHQMGHQAVGQVLVLHALLDGDATDGVAQEASDGQHLVATTRVDGLVVIDLVESQGALSEKLLHLAASGSITDGHFSYLVVGIHKRQFSALNSLTISSMRWRISSCVWV